MSSKYNVEASMVLFEDSHLIAVNKPAGWPAQATVDQKRDHFYAAVQRYLIHRCEFNGSKQFHQNATAYLALHHRLDKDTSGVMLFSKTKDGNKMLSSLFQARAIEKTYRVVALKKKPLDYDDQKLTVGAILRIENHLRKVVRTHLNKRIQLMASVKSGGDHALTEFKVLGFNEKEVYFEAFPHTGRMHQIRVHCASIGFPVLGDRLYGGVSESSKNFKVLKSSENNQYSSPQRLMLHAWKLQFLHPNDKKIVQIEAPLPREFDVSNI